MWENRLYAQGYRLVAGIDEVGRGALAGPVVAAAVILPVDASPRWLSQVKDSKQLTPKKREFLFPLIKRLAVSAGVGVVSHSYIDGHGILRATELAMRLAVEQLSPRPDWLLIDYMRLPGVSIWQSGVADGDSLCLSIASASIVAKVTRDHLLVELDSVYSGYGFARHKGYGTSEHLACLRKLGPSPVHRHSFFPVRQNSLFEDES